MYMKNIVLREFQSRERVLQKDVPAGLTVTLFSASKIKLTARFSEPRETFSNSNKTPSK